MYAELVTLVFAFAFKVKSPINVQREGIEDDAGLHCFLASGWQTKGCLSSPLKLQRPAMFVRRFSQNMSHTE